MTDSGNEQILDSIDFMTGLAAKRNNTHWVPDAMSGRIRETLRCVASSPGTPEQEGAYELTPSEDWSKRPGVTHTPRENDGHRDILDETTGIAERENTSRNRLGGGGGAGGGGGRTGEEEEEGEEKTEGTRNTSETEMAGTVRFNEDVNMSYEPTPDYGMSGLSFMSVTDFDGGDRGRDMPQRKTKNIPGGVHVMPMTSRDPEVNSGGNVLANQRQGKGPPGRQQAVSTLQSDRPSVGPETLLSSEAALEMADLSKMSELTVEKIALCLEKRFMQDAIYTRCGEILISVNPFKPLPIYSRQHQHSYRGDQTQEKPHLFAASASAHQRLTTHKVNQVILVSGESGSGKTEATKYMIQHLMSIGHSTYSASTMQDKIIRVNPLLEAFGNAKTSLNNNSSRFGKFLRLSFNTDDGTIRGARIKDYMLEKTRVVRHGQGEGTFHVFYALLAGADNLTLEGLGLDRTHRYRVTGEFLAQQMEGTDYRQMYTDMRDVFRLIQLNEDEIQDIHCVLAAVILIGDVRFEDSDHDSVLITNEEVVEKVANLLELDMASLTSVLIQRRGVVGKEVINFSKKKKRAEEERDALAKSLYDKLFGWLIWKINESLACAKIGKTADIGILDICGFEDLKDNNFEQLCINLVNEQLQNFMNLKVIEEEQRLYIDEGIMAEGELDTAGINNDAIIKMFLQKDGILDMIDEDSKIEISNEESMVVKLGMKFGNAGIFVPTESNRAEFAIHHFAGKVKYSAERFLAKNTDSLPDMIRDCLISSRSTFVNDLFMAAETATGTISRSQYHFRGSHRPGGRQPVTSRRGQNLSMSINTSSRDIFMKRFGDKKPQIKETDNSRRKTHITFLRNSLEDLLSVMQQSEPHFVRCIKPNDQMVPQKFQMDRVQTQLKYNGVKEVARIRKTAYPIRFPVSDFITRFSGLVGEGRAVTPQAILDAVTAHPSDYRVGTSQVFMRENVQTPLYRELAALEKRREEERMRQMEENQRQGQGEDPDSGALNHSTGTAARHGPGASTRAFGASRPPLGTIDETYPPASTDSIYNSTDSGQTFDSPDPEDPCTESGDSEKTGGWDIFQMLSVEEDRAEVDKQPILMCIKVFVYILFFIVVFIALVCQKVSLVVLISDLNQNETDLPAPKKNEADDTKTLAYILLLIAICVPYGLALLISVAKFCFGNYQVPSFWTWIWVLLMEMLHSVGLTLLVFRVLATLDSVRAIMLLAGGALLPSILKLVMSSPDLGVSTSAVNTVRTRIIDFLVMLVQVSVIPLLVLMHFFPDVNGHSYGAPGWNKDSVFFNDHWHLVEMLGAFVLVSFGYWENFVDDRFLFCSLKKNSLMKNAVLKIRYQLQEGRYLLYSVVYIVKSGLTIWLAFQLRGDISLDYSNAFRLLSWNSETPTSVTAIITVTISGVVAFVGCFLACVFQMQTACMFLPSVLAAPAAVGVIILDCEYNFLSVVTTSSTACPHGPASEYWYHFVICFAWWISLLALCRHVAKPQMDRNANMEKLFINPCYCAVFTGESSFLNRRRNTRKVRMIETSKGALEVVATTYELAKVKEDEDITEDDPEAKREDLGNHGDERPSVFTPMLYACATMWHETRAEMVQLLKSIHRLDKDYAYRKFLAEEIGGYDPDFYNFETHILFDDAMELNDDNEPVPNRWVKQLVSCMTEACSSVHEMPMKLHEPHKVDTPYGGQLIWRMPGGTLLFVHLKDMNKIRNRKRWSQVMYMYYLLAFKLVMDTKESILKSMEEKIQERDGGGLNVQELNTMLGEAHATRISNTFILALDGDMDFSPGAVRILLDRMRDEKVGAACGRIHPIGSGLLVWYQIFEYAIGHWLQKAAEHVFGCVLCSPGCFSLFRAGALMDTNVMKKYTIMATEPKDHLQYDQGEDRWLCTLLLQQGYRIEYAAAADAYTYVPEGFFEFYNQRRRWMPSTIANILDLLGSAGRTTKVNPNLSRPYMLYQWMLMLMTILGPGTILMMIAGAMKLVFSMTQVDSYLFATIPTVVYIIVCFWMKSQTQLIFAAILSVFYSFIMLVVFVGTLVTIGTESIFHPSVLVIVLLVSIFLFAAAAHPQEFGCIVHGLLYLIVIPSAYLLLVIYSILNLNDVSWGTREVPTKAQLLENERKKKEKEEQKKLKKEKGFFAKIFNRGEENIRELTTLIKTLMPERQQAPTSQQRQNATMTSCATGFDPSGQSPCYDDQNLINLLTKIEHNTRMLIEKDSGELSSVLVSQPTTSKAESLGHDHKPSTIDADSAVPLGGPKHQPATQPQEQKSSLTSVKEAAPVKAVKLAKPPSDEPVWLNHESVGRGKIIKLNADEHEFWKCFVRKYLLPIRPTAEQREATAKGLTDLRNSAAFGLIILNTMWMAVNFMFQLTEAAKITIPFTSTQESALGLSFVILLLVLMLLQSVGMTIHRVGTLRHLLAITKISFGKASDQARERYLRFVSRIMKLDLEDDPGAETQAPELCAEDENAFGKTVKGSSFRATDTIGRTGFPLSNTIREGTQLLGMDNYARLDPQSREVWESIQRTMRGDDNRAGMNPSYRPQIPPPRPSMKRFGPGQQLAFTQKDLRHAHVSPTPGPRSSRHHRDVGDMRHLSAMGKSLYLRTQIFNDHLNANRQNSLRWGRSDIPNHDRMINPVEFAGTRF